MIRIAVCDDDACMSDAVRTMAAGFFRRKNREAAVLQFSSGKELLDYDKPVDILFLDIRMKGLDGMETARKLRERDFKGFLIFITVLKEMVFQSFEVQAYDYLLKPPGKSSLKKQWSACMLPCAVPCTKACLSRKAMTAELFYLMRLYMARLLTGKYICI